MTAPHPDPLPPFDRRFLDGTEPLTRIGEGGIGGKAAGLRLLRDRVLRRFPHGEFPEVTVDVPRTVVLAADLFDRFVESNGLAEAVRGQPDHRIAHAFQRASLPVEIAGHLRALAAAARSPLAVRSSSLLEDALEHPFAGVYVTKMIPNLEADADTRFRRLVEAVKLVWASTFFADAVAYRRSIGAEDRAEKMAVAVQEIVGRRWGDRFYPSLAAVARSYSYYPLAGNDPRDGVVDLALGLGRTIVDGGTAWTYCPARPDAPAPFASPRAMLQATQTAFWAVRMTKPPVFDPLQETEYLVEGSLADAEYDDALRFVASTWDAESDRIRPGTGRSGPRVLDFAPILQFDDLPLNGVFRRLLECSREELGADVELELAVVLDPQRGLPARVGLLQVRPMAVSTGAVEVPEADLDRPEAVVASTRVLGHGMVDDLRDMVFLDPEGFAPEATRAIAEAVARRNLELFDARRPYLLLGFGRWGSSDPWLGVPVTWSQICGARVIVEASLPQMNPEPSQGAHFFHNLIARQVAYLGVPHAGGRPIDWAWLRSLPVVHREGCVVHARSETPLAVRVDGRSGRAVVLRHAG